MIFTNPCKKCIVRPCCTAVCGPYIIWNRRRNRLLAPFIFIVTLYKERAWALLSAFVGLYIAVLVQTIFILHLIASGD